MFANLLRFLARSRIIKIACVAPLALLSAGIVTTTPADAVPVWTLNGVTIGAELPAAVRLVGFFESSFTEGTSRYTIACNTDGVARSGRLYATSPGTDRMDVFTLPVANCTVKIGTTATGCVLAVPPELQMDSNSTLGGTGPSSYTDAFASFEVIIDLTAKVPEVCNPTGNYVMRGGAAMTGSWANSASQVTFNGVSVTLGTFTTPTFSAVYHISSPTNRVGVGEASKGAPADWRISGTLLASGTKDETVEESAAVEVVSEILGTKIGVKCTVGSSTSTITGGQPGTGTSSIALEKCSSIGLGECKVEEPVELGKPKSKLVLLTEEHLGAKFEGFSGTISFSGAKCLLGAKFALAGNSTALFNKTSEEFEFTESPQEGSTLQLGGSSAKLVGKFKNSLSTSAGVTG